MSQNPSVSISEDDSLNTQDNTNSLDNNQQNCDSVIFSGTNTNSFRLGDIEWFDNLPVMNDDWWNSNIEKRNKVSEMWKKSFNDIIEYEIKACKLDLEISNLKVQADSITNRICCLSKISP